MNNTSQPHIVSTTFTDEDVKRKQKKDLSSFSAQWWPWESYLSLKCTKRESTLLVTNPKIVGLSHSPLSFAHTHTHSPLSFTHTPPCGSFSLSSLFRAHTHSPLSFTHTHTHTHTHPFFTRPPPTPTHADEWTGILIRGIWANQTVIRYLLYKQTQTHTFIGYNTEGEKKSVIQTNFLS